MIRQTQKVKLINGMQFKAPFTGLFTFVGLTQNLLCPYSFFSNFIPNIYINYKNNIYRAKM